MDILSAVLAFIWHYLLITLTYLFITNLPCGLMFVGMLTIWQWDIVRNRRKQRRIRKDFEEKTGQPMSVYRDVNDAAIRAADKSLTTEDRRHDDDALAGADQMNRAGRGHDDVRSRRRGLNRLARAV